MIYTTKNDQKLDQRTRMRYTNGCYSYTHRALINSAIVWSEYLGHVLCTAHLHADTSWSAFMKFKGTKWMLHLVWYIVDVLCKLSYLEHLKITQTTLVYQLKVRYFNGQWSRLFTYVFSYYESFNRIDESCLYGLGGYITKGKAWSSNGDTNALPTD